MIVVSAFGTVAATTALGAGEVHAAVLIYVLTATLLGAILLVAGAIKYEATERTWANPRRKTVAIREPFH